MLKRFWDNVKFGFKADVTSIVDFAGSVLILARPRFRMHGEVSVSDIIDLAAVRERRAALGLRAGQHRLGVALGTANQNGW